MTIALVALALSAPTAFADSAPEPTATSTASTDPATPDTLPADPSTAKVTATPDASEAPDASAVVRDVRWTVVGDGGRPVGDTTWRLTDAEGQQWSVTDGTDSGLDQ